MSYILESLKKSERERQQSESPVLAAMTSAPFLEKATEKSRLNPGSIFLLLTLLLVIAVAIYYGFVQFDRKSNHLSSVVTEPASANSMAATDPEKHSTFASVVKNSGDQQRQEAVELYQQTVNQRTIDDNNSDPAIDRLYRRIGEESQTAAINAKVDSITTVESVTKPVETAAINETPLPAIPTIYSLDSASKRSIPKIDYGAHVYASDNKSGFVILNGARARIGDHLGNGVYIEKIEEDSVILSYSGMLFSLPAMKSWSGE